VLGDQRRAGPRERLRERPALRLGPGLALELGDGALTLAAIERVARRVDVPPQVADLGSGVLNTAMGETAAYCLAKEAPIL
jgi:hypothetical protein